MSHLFKHVIFFILLCHPFTRLFAQDFVIYSKTIKSTIVYDAHGPVLDSIAAYLLQQDIKSVTGFLPPVVTDISKAGGNVIVIGNVHAALIRGLLSADSAFSQHLSGKWECYATGVLNQPAKHISKALIIAGSDARGTAYGVFSISEKIGVSPWYWWADVPVVKQSSLVLHGGNYTSTPPSVKYRGIFLNDEDWGLQVWAAKTFERETGDIGPKTYAKIFELLLRLKANLIWPAMHPCTKAFYHYPGNVRTAADYGIMIGSSHAEPMLRNNVGEWTKEMGAFNYKTNKEKVLSYWEQRVKESSDNEVIYTLGMRGIHDGAMEGVKDVNEAVPLLEGIVADQRALLKKYAGKKITDIPQVFTAYKEVLDIYDNNLRLPEDVTLVWPDDNYGYINRLSNDSEQLRAGGAGIYYHASYWGRPHDYLWLSSTHPGLIREEMMKAYEMKADRLWVLNVGDLKPLEYNMQFFLDMAYDATPFKNSDYARQHLEKWTARIFGKKQSGKIADILWQNYDLAFERKPEFMGWSQTEPTTPVNYSSYNHFYYGDEAQRRINQYDALEKAVKAIRPQIAPAAGDAFYQLVYYPVIGAAMMNKKFLYRDKSMLYARQNRLSAKTYADKSIAVYRAIVDETTFYNNQLANGKWKHMMSMQPRNLPVFLAPELPAISIDSSGGWGIAPEGKTDKDSSDATVLTLPVFNSSSDRKYFIDLFLSNKKAINWQMTATSKWIKVSQDKGVLKPVAGQEDSRIWVSVDWGKFPKETAAEGTLVFTGDGKVITVQVKATDDKAALPVNFKGFVEDNGYLSLLAKHYTRSTAKQHAYWQKIAGLGPVETSLIAMPLQQKAGAVKTDELQTTAPCLEYDYYTFTAGIPEIKIYTLPVHPLNNHLSLRYGVAIDDGPITVLDHKTYGRSQEWKQNVLSNTAVKSVKGNLMDKGWHTLKIYMIDPGVVLQYITIDVGGLKQAYGIIPETKKQ